MKSELEISIISLNRLIVGGAAILAAVRRNHIRVIEGKSASIPFTKYRLRVWVISYIMLAIANRPEELRPWAIIMSRAPSHPQGAFDISPAMRIPICPTDEYAIKDFMSVCRKQIILVMHAPQSLKAARGAVREVFTHVNIIETRANP